MEPPRISVIVPVYNVEKYLSHCIDSIITQTFTDFELLLVDDGSTDGSGKICDYYAGKDERVKVFHNENKGVSAARNQGLKEAAGDWICFVDSDDWVENDYLQCLLYDGSLIGECIVCQSFYVENESCPEKRYKSRLYPDTILREPFDEHQMMAHILNDFSVNIFSKLFKKRVLNDNKIYFNEKTSVFEDAIFLHEYLLHIKEIHLRSSVSYHYMQRNNVQSLTRRRHSCEELVATADELLKINELLIKKFSISNPDNRKALYNKYGLCQLYSACIIADKSNYLTIFGYVKGKKSLFKKYYVPFTLEQKVFSYIFFAGFLSSKMFFYISWLYKSLLHKIR